MENKTSTNHENGNDANRLLGVVSVSWSELNENDKSDLEDKKLFEKSIRGYVELFKSLPPKGLMIDNGNCDAACIEEFFFNGIDKSLYVYLSF
jgi:hypothetical protein